MKILFAVTRSRGCGWDNSKPLRSQAQWDEHAAFMDKLAADGVVILGGPVGDEEEFLLAVNAADENEICSIFSEDCWSRSGILEILKIQRWTILLQAGK